MRARNGDGFVLSGDDAQSSASFNHLVFLFSEVDELWVTGGNSGRVNHQRVQLIVML